jgi:hypothetical protein
VASNPAFTTPDEEDVLGCHDCDVADLCSGFVDRWMDALLSSASASASARARARASAIM